MRFFYHTHVTSENLFNPTLYNICSIVLKAKAKLAHTRFQENYSGKDNMEFSFVAFFTPAVRASRK